MHRFVQAVTRRRTAIGLLSVHIMLTACAGPGANSLTGSLAPVEPPTSRKSAPPVDVARLAAAHKANPADPAAAVAYARALRVSGAKAEGLAALDKTAIAQPHNRQLQLERGLLALDLGDTAKAEKLLRLAGDGKEWRVHSALGTALALGGKQPEAQAQFAKALALAPDNPIVLNNLALSYALDGKGAEAEKLLRKAQRSAPPTPSLQQNLALVLGLRGKYAEARSVAEVTLAPAQAGENINYLQRLSATAQSEPDRPKAAAVVNTAAHEAGN